MWWMAGMAATSAISSFLSIKGQNSQVKAEAEAKGKAAVQGMKNAAIAAEIDHELLEDKRRTAAIQTSIEKLSLMRDSLRKKGSIKASEGTSKELAAVNVSSSFENDIITENYELQEEAINNEHVQVDATHMSRYNQYMSEYNMAANPYMTSAGAGLLQIGTSAASGALIGHQLGKI